MIKIFWKINYKEFHYYLLNEFNPQQLDIFFFINIFSLLEREMIWNKEQRFQILNLL